MVGAKCSHEQQTRSGSNQFQDRISCVQCRKLLYLHYFHETSIELLRETHLPSVMSGAALEAGEKSDPGDALPTALEEDSADPSSSGRRCHIQ